MKRGWIIRCAKPRGAKYRELIASLSLAIEAGQEFFLGGIANRTDSGLGRSTSFGRTIHSRQPQQQAEVQALYERYAAALHSKKGQTASIAYRMRNLFLDRWNLWPRLTFYRTWKDSNGIPF